MVKERSGDGRAGWFSKKDMARMFDCTESYFDHDIRVLDVKQKYERKVGVSLEFFARGFIDLMIARKVGTNGHAANGDLLSGPPTPSRERLIAAKAQREEIALERDKRSYAAVELMWDGYGVVAAAYRRAADRIQKQFGQVAFEILQEAAEDAEREMGMRFGR